MMRLSLSASLLALTMIAAAIPARAERLSSGDLAKGWTIDGMVGLNSNFTNSHAWTGGEGMILAASAFADLRAVFDYSIVFWDFRLQAEYGMIKVPDQPVRKGVDVFDLDAWHVWQITTWVNPYIRVTADSRFSNTERFFDRPKQLSIRYDNRIESRFSDRLKVSTGLNPTLFGEAFGAYFTALKNKDGYLAVLVGFGGRQLVTSEFLVEHDRKSTPQVEFDAIDTYAIWGPEVAVDFRYQPVKGLTVTSGIDAFMSLDSEWVAEWKTTAAYQIWRIFYLRGTFEGQYDSRVLKKFQTRQDIMLSLAFRFGNDGVE